MRSRFRERAVGVFFQRPRHLHRPICSIIAIAASLVFGGCRRTTQPLARPLQLIADAKIEDEVSVENQTWLVVAPKHGPRLLCRHADHAITCSVVPGSEAGARLVEPSGRAAPLVALPTGSGSAYVEPFTWKRARSLDSIPFDRRGVVLDDGTLWLEDIDNLIVAAPHQPPRRWFAETIGKNSIASSGAVWVDYRGSDPATAAPVVKSAPFRGASLGPAIEHPGLEPWGLVACRARTTVGFLQLHHRELAMLDLATGAVVRGPANEATDARCRAGEAAALPPEIDGHTLETTWCDHRGCSSRDLRPPFEMRGHYTLVDRGILGTGTVENRLVTWECGAGVPAKMFDLIQSPSSSTSAPTSGGILVLFDTGELVELDRHGSRVPVTLHWIGPPASGG